MKCIRINVRDQGAPRTTVSKYIYCTQCAIKAAERSKCSSKCGCIRVRLRCTFEEKFKIGFLRTDLRSEGTVANTGFKKLRLPS